MFEFFKETPSREHYLFFLKRLRSHIDDPDLRRFISSVSWKNSGPVEAQFESLMELSETLIRSACDLLEGKVDPEIGKARVLELVDTVYSAGARFMETSVRESADQGAYLAFVTIPLGFLALAKGCEEMLEDLDRID